MLIRSSHGFLSSVFFVSFLFSGRYFGGLFHSRACLNTWGPPWTNVLAGKSTSASENQKFDVRLVLSWSNGSGDANFANNRTYSINKDLLSSLPTWNGNNILFEFPVGPLRRPRQLFLALKVKIKRQKRPCAYYSNTTATFHCLLVGDLVFKLNPGPVDNSTESTLCSHGVRKTLRSSQSRNSSNLIVVNRLPLVRNLKLSLSFCLMNTRSVRNKSADIHDFVCEYKVDLLAITETWLNANDDAVRVELCPTGYKFCDHPRTGRSGGGTALLYRDSLHVVKISAGEKESFEFSEWIVQQRSSHNLRVVILYRPPYSDEHRVPTSTFFSELSDYLESIVLCQEKLLISGDFNIHVDDAGDTDSIKLLDLLESYGLRQHVTGPTHKHDHTLDLIITRQSDQLLRNSPHAGRYISDHAAVLCSIHSDKPSLTVRKVSYRKLKSVNVDSLNEDLATSELCQNPSDDLQELVTSYNDTLRAALDKHAPLITRTIVERPRVPWFSEEIREAKRQRRKAEKRWRVSRLDYDLAVFKEKRNATTRLMNKARREFYSNFIDENSGDQRKLFRASQRLFNRTVDDGLPPHLDSAAFTNDLGKYFVQKIVTIRRQLDTDPADSHLGTAIPSPAAAKSAPSFPAFTMLSDNDVKLLIQNSALKSCPLDPMPSTLVSKCEVLLPVLTNIINTSLQSGHFPEPWKEALVFPLLKKPGLDCIFKNFRPVSNLPFVSKLTERAAFNQTHGHMVSNNLYPDAQSAYRRNHSTETALLKVMNDILLNMNKQHVTILVLLDLSAAFDTVDHDILLERLSSKLGLNGTALGWFRSYLSGRSQRVSVRGSVSEKFDLCYGVPQGSCLGPLLFTIYASALFDVVRKHLPTVHCYADDTQLYISFSPVAQSGQADAVAAIEHCTHDIRKWMSQDKLLMNDAKTELLLIGTRQQLAKVRIDSITIGNSDIAPQSPVRNLGVWLDCNLSMGDHITKTSSVAFYYLYNIRRIRKYLSKECTETLIHAFISSRIDYCNSLLYGLPACQLQKLQRVQNSAARLVFEESKFCHITPLLKSLHWLPVKYRIDFKVLLLTFKAIHGLAPPYISELISVKDTSGRYSLRSNSGILLNFRTCKSLTTLGDRSFYMAAPKLWNNLPLFIRNISFVNSFKKSLKTHLFQKAFFS